MPEASDQIQVCSDCREAFRRSRERGFYRPRSKALPDSTLKFPSQEVSTLLSETRKGPFGSLMPEPNSARAIGIGTPIGGSHVREKRSGGPARSGRQARWTKRHAATGTASRHLERSRHCPR